MISKKLKLTLVLCAILTLAPLAARADVQPLPDFRHICLTMANGAFYDDSVILGPTYDRACTPIAWEQYYYKHDGGGLNELHITADLAQPYGTVTEFPAEEQSGAFYITNTGGRGYTQEAVLLVSVNAASLPANFGVRIQSSGYELEINPDQTIARSTYNPAAIDETFTAEDFANYGYGPQTWKPSNVALFPLWYGQDTSDATTESLLLFIDLGVGALKTGIIPEATDNGAARVDFTFTNLPGLAAFNVLGYGVYTNQGQGISWTNDTRTGVTYPSSITVLPPPPPEPPQGWEPAAQAATIPGADRQGSHAANVLFMILVPAGLVTASKLAVRRFRSR